MTAPQTTPLILLSDLTQAFETGGETTKPAYYRKIIVEASQRVQDWCLRRFDEHVDTRLYTPFSISDGGDLDGYELYLDADLRSVTTLNNGDGSTIDSSSYHLLPLNKPDKQAIRLKSNAGVFWTAGGNDPIGALSLAGLWGYGGEWVATGATANGAINDSVTTLPVNDGTLVEVGMVLKLDSEYCYVSAVTTNNVTITRGYNNSTADSHIDETIVYRWQAHPLVQSTVMFLVLWTIERYKSRLTGEAFIADAGIPITVSAVPKEAQDNVKILKRKRNLIGAV